MLCQKMLNHITQSMGLNIKEFAISKILTQPCGRKVHDQYPILNQINIWGQWLKAKLVSQKCSRRTARSRFLPRHRAPPFLQAQLLGPQLSEAQLSEAQLSGAQFFRGPIVTGPVVRGPIVPCPVVLGPSVWGHR